MPIAFDHKRWQTVKQNARDWWAGKLGRPLIHMTLGGRAPGRTGAKIGIKRGKTMYDLSVTPEDIVDCWDYDLSCREYLGDSFPSVWPNFGPGVLAAFLGAKADPVPETITVWFHPDRDREAKDIHFSINPDNVWLRRIKDICRAAHARWNGMVQVSMTDLGGNLDVLSTFRPGERLLLDLVDCPDEVKRLTWEEHAAWWKAFDEINAILRPANPGYTAWAPIFSETSYYMLQCDFCYMIGPEMFDEFVKPELEASCKRLDHAFYHLDGVGQLPHLDSLLAIKELKGVQWVPGDGKPQGEAWPEVYRKILKSGKRAQFVGDWRNFDKLVDQVGGAENFVVFGAEPADKRKEVEAFLKRHGAL